MSLMSMKRMAIERDVREPRKPVSSKKNKKGAEALDPADETTQARDVLVSAIPTEILAPYTAVVAGIVATIDPGESDRLLMRWILYGAGVALIVAYLGWTYSQKKATNGRKFPWAETLAAVLAFGAWGLVMPGSPFAVSVKGDDLVIWTSIITFGGAAAIGLLVGGQLKKKAT